MLPIMRVYLSPSIRGLRSCNALVSMVHCAALAGALASSASVHGAELPDCKLYNAQDVNAQYKPVGANMAMQLDPATLKPGQELIYSKDQPVLISDVKFVESAPVLVATGDFVLKSSWMMNPDWKFRKGQPIEVRRALVGRDGRDYAVISPDRGMVVFLNPDGEFCNQTLKVANSTPIWLVGHLTRIPDDATVEWQSKGSEVASGRLRIIYSGTSAGAMHFQEVWVKGSQIVASNDRQFDQFASEIQIAGLAFKVAEVKGDSVRLAYSFGSNVVLPHPVLRDIPIASLH